MADYMINLEKYKKNCVNKNKPKLHCNGKCQMMKKMRQSSSGDSSAPIQKQFQINFDLSTNTNFPSFVIFATNNKQKYFVFDEDTLYFYSTDLFHPPSIA